MGITRARKRLTLDAAGNALALRDDPAFNLAKIPARAPAGPPTQFVDRKGNELWSDASTDEDFTGGPSFVRFGAHNDVLDVSQGENGLRTVTVRPEFTD